MGRANSHKKKIACIESLWDGNIEHRLSVVPMLELSERVNDVGWAYLTCNTEEELRYNLGKLRNRRGYGILYLACHGRPGELVFDKDTVEIEKLGQFMGDGFTNWVVHFGSCATLNLEHARISRFIVATRVSMVLGDANTSVAYLQDPATKRVGGYHVGEPIAGGIVRAIDADRVVLERHGSRVEVRLRDPLRPRQAVVAASEGSDVREAAVATVESPRQNPTSQISPLAPRPLMPSSRNYRPPFPRLVPAGGLPVMAPQESASAGTRAGR